MSPELVCQRHFYNPQCQQSQKPRCEAVIGLLENNGCLSTVVSTKTFQLYRSYARMYASFNIETIVTEMGQVIQMKNYELRCSQISAILAESSDYKAEVLSPEGNTARVCANERKPIFGLLAPQS